MNTFSEFDKIPLDMVDADVVYVSNFLNSDVATTLFQNLLAQTPWQHDNIVVFGKQYKQPRLTALYATNDKSYSYSGITMRPYEFSKDLEDLRSKLNLIAQTNFTTCLLNLYRDGSDSNGWHADDEKELGINPTIASISLGADRMFHFKHRTRKDLKKKILLRHGSLLLMKGATQHHWLHQLPKTKKQIGKRINLTFRIIA